jgi:hypothetical protein
MNSGHSPGPDLALYTVAICERETDAGHHVFHVILRWF